MAQRLLWLALLVAATAVPTTTAALQRQYKSSTALDGSVAMLHWSLSSTTIELGLVITAPAVVSPNATALWMGFGIGDPSSGSMLGADIVTAEFGGATGGGGPNCTLVDRHVPMVSYPLASSVGGDAVFPAVDDCPNKDSWVLAGCAVDPTAGTLTLEASRSLAAPDPAQDRDIVPGSNLVMVAHGDGFGYHGAARRVVEVDLSSSGAAAVSAGDLASTGQVPADADGSMLLSMPNYTVPSITTDYGCAAFELDPPPPGEVVQMVAAETVVDTNTTGGRLVHHLVLLSCAKTDAFDAVKSGKSCFGGMAPSCTDTVFTWALGAKPLILPAEAGLPITADQRYFMLQIHYDNPTHLVGVTDTTGVRLHTTTKARKFDSGTITLGNLRVKIPGERVASANYTYTCPSECTSQMANRITVFDSVLHAHYTALQMWTNVYRNGTFLKTIEGSKHWSNEHQRPTLFEPTELWPGDRLTVSAEFGVDKLLAAGKPAPGWDFNTHDEMILSVLFVYPRPQRVGGTSPADTITGCGGWHVRQTGADVTLCLGRVALLKNRSALVEGVDVFNFSARATPDEAGWSDPFNEQPTCLAARPGGPPAPVSADGGQCFPAAATVRRRLRGGAAATVRMDELALGDEVLGADGAYTPVYLFSHADPEVVAPFVELTAVTTRVPQHACGGPRTCPAGTPRTRSLVVSGGHLLPATTGGRGGAPALSPAASLAVGDSLTAADGTPLLITSVASVAAPGLFHPHTLSGTLVVDGVLVSDRTTALPGVLAAGLLAPLRAAYGVGWVAPAALASRLLTAGCPAAVRGVAAALGSVVV